MAAAATLSVWPEDGTAMSGSFGKIDIGQEVGSGAQGRVLSATIGSDKRSVVLKLVAKDGDKTSAFKSNILTDVYTELQILRALDMVTDSPDWYSRKLALSNCLDAFASEITCDDPARTFEAHPPCLMLMFNQHGKGLGDIIQAEKPAHDAQPYFDDKFDMGVKLSRPQRAAMDAELPAAREAFWAKMNGPLTTPVTGLRICEQILRALEYLHGKGFVYADIKPDNICLHETDPGRVMLIDFGITSPFKLSTSSGSTVHIPYSYQGRKIDPSFAFVPTDVLKGHAESRRGEMESLLYLACYLCGTLPWRQFVTDYWNSDPKFKQSDAVGDQPAAMKALYFNSTADGAAMKDPSTPFLADNCALPAAIRPNIKSFEQYVGSLTYESDIKYADIAQWLNPAASGFTVSGALVFGNGAATSPSGPKSPGKLSPARKS